MRAANISIVDLLMFYKICCSYDKRAIILKNLFICC